MALCCILRLLLHLVDVMYFKITYVFAYVHNNKYIIPVINKEYIYLYVLTYRMTVLQRVIIY